MERNIYLTIAIAATITGLMRTLPVILLSRFSLSGGFRQWLNFIPSAIMAAIIMAELMSKPATTPSGISVSLLSAIIAALTGIVTRGLFATVIAGMMSFYFLEYLLTS